MPMIAAGFPTVPDGLLPAMPFPTRRSHKSELENIGLAQWRAPGAREFQVVWSNQKPVPSRRKICKVAAFFVAWSLVFPRPVGYEREFIRKDGGCQSSEGIFGSVARRLRDTPLGSTQPDGGGHSEESCSTATDFNSMNSQGQP